MNKIPTSLCKLKELIQTGQLSIVKASSEIKQPYIGIIERQGVSCKEFIEKMQFKKFLNEICFGKPVDVLYEITNNNTIEIEVGKLCPYMEETFLAKCVFEGITVEKLMKKLELKREDLFEEIKGKW